MVFTSAALRLTALLQLAHLIVGQRASAPAVKLGLLAVRAPDEGNQVSAAWACLPTTRAGTGRQPPSGRASVAPAALVTVPLRGVVEHLQRVRETDAAAGVVRGG
jgi:hypothetical protein